MNVLVVTNLRAGFGDSGLSDFIRELGLCDAEVTMRFLNEGADLGHLLRDVRAYDRVVASGGDGTVSAVAYALRGTNIPLLAYPAGTANLIARNLRLPIEAKELAEATIAGVTVPIDLGEVTFVPAGTTVPVRRGFSVGAGAGFDARMMAAAQSLKGSLGEGAYLVAALQNLAPTVSRFTLTLDGKTVETEGIAVLLMNLARIQFDLAVAHDADGGDGLLEVVVLKTRTAAGLLPAVWAAMLDRLRNHPERPGLEIHTAATVQVHADPALPLEYDGEVVDATTPFSARVLPGAARYIVGPDYGAASGGVGES